MIDKAWYPFPAWVFANFTTSKRVNTFVNKRFRMDIFNMFFSCPDFIFFLTKRTFQTSLRRNIPCGNNHLVFLLRIFSRSLLSNSLNWTDALLFSARQSWEKQKRSVTPLGDIKTLNNHPGRSDRAHKEGKNAHEEAKTLLKKQKRSVNPQEDGKTLRN